jgi:hypothetical protein
MSYYKISSAIALGAVALCLPSVVSADALFSDPGESLDKFKIVRDSGSTDSTVTSVDYGQLGIPEAPRKIVGSAAKTGLQIIANKGDDVALTTGLNLILGADPIVFSGTHTLQFDAWMNAPFNATSTTEGLSAGTGRSATTDGFIRNFRTSRGNSQGGAWFYLTGDNGNSTDDFRLLNGGTSTVNFGDGTDAPSAAKFNAAFSNSYGAANAEPANEWVQVNIVQDGTTVSVYFNGVLFGTETSTNTSGFAWLGYEDQFNSIGSPTLYGVFDNITVLEGVSVPEPTSIAAVALAGIALGSRRRRRSA